MLPNRPVNCPNSSVVPSTTKVMTDVFPLMCGTPVRASIKSACRITSYNVCYTKLLRIPAIRRIIDQSKDGYQSPEIIHQLFDAAGIPRVKEQVVTTENEALAAASDLGYPLVMKVIGPVHKTDVGGVVLNVRRAETVASEFKRLMAIPETTAVLMAEMASGIELFIGAKYEDRFGHIMLCGMGGIMVEVLKDVTSGLAPLTICEASSMIKNLKSYQIIKGYRGQEGVDQRKFAEVIVRLSSLLRFATEIKEMDINPLLGRGDKILAVDARIRIER